MVFGVRASPDFSGNIFPEIFLTPKKYFSGFSFEPENFPEICHENFEICRQKIRQMEIESGVQNFHCFDAKSFDFMWVFL